MLPGEQLLVFVASGGEIARSFDEEHLPQLRAAAEELGVGVRVIDVAGGAPGEEGSPARAHLKPKLSQIHALGGRGLSLRPTHSLARGPAGRHPSLI